MPPIDPNLLAMIMQVYPEWVGGAGKNAHYAPPDVGSQASQLNAMQDMLQLGSNPLMAGLLPGGMDPSAFEDILDEKNTIPAITAGADTLNAVIAHNPESVDGLLAQMILDGNTADEAVDLLVQSGRIPTPKKLDKDGNETHELDLSAKDRYLKKADQWYSLKLSDKEGKESYMPSPAMQAYLDAGYTDPRQQYSADYVNGSIEGTYRDADANAMDMLRQAVAGRDAQAAEAARPQPQRDPLAAQVVDGMMARLRGDAGPVGSLLPEPTLPNVGDDPAAWLKASEELDRVRNHNADVKKRQSQAKPQTAASSYRSQSHVSPGTAKRAANDKVKRATKDAVDVRRAGANSTSYGAGQAAAMRKAGRTPFIDQFAQRQAMLRAMGLGG